MCVNPPHCVKYRPIEWEGLSSAITIVAIVGVVYRKNPFFFLSKKLLEFIEKDILCYGNMNHGGGCRCYILFLCSGQK